MRFRKKITFHVNPMRLRQNISIFIVLFLLLGRFSSANSPEPDVKKVLDRLERTWKVQENEIATAHIHFRESYGQTAGLPQCNALTPEEVWAIIDSVDYSSAESAFAELLDRLYPTVPAIGELELHYAPPKSSLKTKIPKQDEQFNQTSLTEYVEAFDGANTIQVNPLNNQTSVTLQGNIYPLSKLRSNTPFRTREIRDKFSFKLNGNYLQAMLSDDDRKNHITKLFDVETGLCISRTSHFKDSNGIGRDRFQQCFFTSPGGIVFPKLSVEICYEKGRSNIIQLYLIEEAVFNTTIPEEAFQVSVPANVNVFDHRYNERDPAHTKLDTDTSDVISVVGDYTDYTAKPQNGLRWMTIVSVNALILLLIVWRLFRKVKV